MGDLRLAEDREAGDGCTLIYPSTFEPSRVGVDRQKRFDKTGEADVEKLARAGVGHLQSTWGRACMIRTIVDCTSREGTIE